MRKVEDYCKKSKTDSQNYQELYVSTARTLFEDIANGMKNFLAKVYKNSEAELCKPPCKYAIIGLGSMALKQVTPYSDLEFAILTEYYNSRVKKYFTNLSNLVNFKIINLGESIIPTSKYALDMSHLVHVAVNLDLGGKTPLGRIDGDKKYELIQTVDCILKYVHNEVGKPYR